jgi:TRAP-type C4-dicarboxylate transport system permease small subunit
MACLMMYIICICWDEQPGVGGMGDGELMKKFQVGRIIEGFIQSASNILMILIMILVFVEVVSRYVFGQSHGFMEEFSKWAQIWIAYLMLGVIEKGRQHITVDVLSRRMPKRYQTAMFIVLDIITLVFCVVLFFSGVETAINWRVLGYISNTGIPLWIVMLSAPLGAIFLAFFAIEHIIADFRSIGDAQKGADSIVEHR